MYVTLILKRYLLYKTLDKIYIDQPSDNFTIHLLCYTISLTVNFCTNKNTETELGKQSKEGVHWI